MSDVIQNQLCLSDPQRQTSCPGTLGGLAERVRNRLRTIASDPRREGKLLVRTFLLLYRLMGDPGVPWRAKIAAGVSVCYVLSPIQLIPSLIPLIGQLDDLLAIWIAMKLVRKCTPQSVLKKHLRQLDLAAG